MISPRNASERRDRPRRVPVLPGWLSGSLLGTCVLVLATGCLFSVTDATTPDGQEVLLPIRDKIRTLGDSLFVPSSVDDLALVSAEGASVAVLNGARVNGLAQATADWLRAQGIHVVAVGTADRSNYAQTQIVDYSGKPHTTAWLARTLHVLSTTASSDPGIPADIQIILGADWSVPVSGSSTH